jgi:hypothetical protein
MVLALGSAPFDAALEPADPSSPVEYRFVFIVA